VVTEITRKPIPPYRRALVFETMTSMTVSNQSGENGEENGEPEEVDVEIPFIKYYI
jgi:hypothetical protein